MRRSLLLPIFLVPFLTHGQSGAVRQHHDAFIPDTIVGGVLLCDTTSAISHLGRIRYDDLVPLGPDGLPRAHFHNKDKTEILTLYFHPGTLENQYAEANISRSTKEKVQASLPLMHFTTGRGINLGMSEAEVLRALGTSGKHTGTTKGRSILEYSLQESDSPAFLARFNYYRYFATFTFEQGKLVNYRFGFEQP